METQPWFIPASELDISVSNERNVQSLKGCTCLLDLLSYVSVLAVPVSNANPWIL